MATLPGSTRSLAISRRWPRRCPRSSKRSPAWISSRSCRRYRGLAPARRSRTSLVHRSTTMGLLERVSTLVRANLNDLIDRAENASKMIKQVILDMENQLLQVKTQVAISMADQHLLHKKQAEHEDRAAEWMKKAELAVDKQQDDLARAALERYQSFT